MTSSLWEDVLMLLMVMMLADGRVLDVEIEAFEQAVTQLQDRLEPGEGALPAASLRLWYERNVHRARELTLREDFDSALVPLLVRLQTLDDRQALLDGLGHIADADMHRASSERDVITLASAFWGLVNPVAPKF